MHKKKDNEKILNGHPFLKRVLLFDKKNKFKSLRLLLTDIRKNKYDIVVNAHRHFSSGLMTALSGAKVKIGFKSNPLSFFFSKKIPYNREQHEVERNQKLIAYLSDDKAVLPKLHPSESDWEFVSENYEGAYFTISPASIWPTKTLPLIRWVVLIDALPANKKVYLMGSASDAETCERLKVMCKNQSVVILAGKLSFLKDAALMARAEMNYVLDSGPLHICSAMNAPVTAVFCSTSTKYGFGPLSEHSIIIETKEKLSCPRCGTS
jgi:heptosyltransferase-2